MATGSRRRVVVSEGSSSDEDANNGATTQESPKLRKAVDRSYVDVPETDSENDSDFAVESRSSLCSQKSDGSYFSVSDSVGDKSIVEQSLEQSPEQPSSVRVQSSPRRVARNSDLFYTELSNASLSTSATTKTGSTLSVKDVDQQQQNYAGKQFTEMRRSLAAVVCPQDEDSEELFGSDQEEGEEDSDVEDTAATVEGGESPKPQRTSITSLASLSSNRNTSAYSDRKKTSGVEAASTALEANKTFSPSTTDAAYLSCVNSSNSSSKAGSGPVSVLQSSLAGSPTGVKNHEVYDIEEKMERMQKDLSQLELAKTRTNIQLLPDFGERLQARIAERKQKIADLETMRQELINQNVSGTTSENQENSVVCADNSSDVVILEDSPRKFAEPEPVVHPKSSGDLKHQFNPPSSRDRSSTQTERDSRKTAVILPHHPPPPPSFYQNLEDRNRLFGGRMNDARWREARTVTNEALENFHKTLSTLPPEDMETPNPRGLTVSLMQHQRIALTWLLWRETQNPPGGILADDMGLGKTLTMIALSLMQKQQRKEGVEREHYNVLAKKRHDLIKSHATLVICPASLMGQWESEIKKRVKEGRLRCLLYHGTKRESLADRLARYDVVITSYGVIRSEVGPGDESKSEDVTKDDSGDSNFYGTASKSKNAARKKKDQSGDCMLTQILWERIVLDEAHNIKNHKSVQAKSVCRLTASARWVVTGTPIHNKLEEFYSLLKFLRCYPFDELGIWKLYIEGKGEKANERLKTLVKTLLLRRTKEQINPSTGTPYIELPPKKLETYNLIFNKTELEVYDKLMKASQVYVKEFIKSQEEKDRELIGISSSSRSVNNKQLGFRNPFLSAASNVNDYGAIIKERPRATDVLVMLLRLRQACCHMYLMKAAVDINALREEGGIEMDLAEQFQSLDIVEQTNDIRVQTLFTEEFQSTKVKALLERMQDILSSDGSDGRKQKCIVVSQWVGFLKLLGSHLTKAGIQFTTLTGEVIPAERNMRVERFNRPGGEQVMLLSLCAGGVGLNLIGGNHLILMDLHWNPALEQQASDRIYRMGQTRNVFIHKFVCKDTVEEKILALQAEKLKLASGVLSGAGANNLNKLTLSDLKLLFGLDQPVTRQPLKPQNLVSLPKPEGHHMDPFAVGMKPPRYRCY